MISTELAKQHAQVRFMVIPKQKCVRIHVQLECIKIVQPKDVLYATSIVKRALDQRSTVIHANMDGLNLEHYASCRQVI